MSDFRPGCGDNSCIFSIIRASGGMGTNGGCRCFKNLELHTEIVGTDGNVMYDNREQLQHLRQSVQKLVSELRLTQKELDDVKEDLYISKMYNGESSKD